MQSTRKIINDLTYNASHAQTDGYKSIYSHLFSHKQNNLCEINYKSTRDLSSGAIYEGDINTLRMKEGFFLLEGNQLSSQIHLNIKNNILVNKNAQPILNLQNKPIIISNEIWNKVHIKNDGRIMLNNETYDRIAMVRSRTLTEENKKCVTIYEQDDTLEFCRGEREGSNFSSIDYTRELTHYQNCYERVGSILHKSYKIQKDITHHLMKI